MADINCHEDMQGFHDKEVTLGSAQRSEMHDRREAGRTRLKNGLDKAGHSGPSEIQSQGSYAMRTMVQDSQNDYDIDDGVYFRPGNLQQDGKDLDPKGARTRVRGALKDDRLKYDAVVKDNCVRQHYPEGYHIDIPVYRIRQTTDPAGKEVDKYDLASGDAWVESDAREVTRWFKSKAASDQLQRLVRLTKKQARSRNDWKKNTSSGITITKLVIDHQRLVAGRDDLALRQTWQAIKNQLDYSQQVAHPIPGINDLAKDGDEEVKFFRDKLDEALEVLKALDSASCTVKHARTAWNKVFNCNYFTDLPDGADDSGSSKASGPFIATGGKTNRDDNKGRFG
jgi:hypothetical protein